MPLINSSYDKLLELRLYSPKVDPSILVLDIDERSLDEMRSDYGALALAERDFGGCPPLA